MERNARNLEGENGHMEMSEMDEQASSDDEESSYSQHGLTHPSAFSRSVYSRIHEDVLFRIPSIDLNFAEADKDGDDDAIEAELVITPGNENSAGNLHADDVNGQVDSKPTIANGTLEIAIETFEKPEGAPPIATERHSFDDQVNSLHERTGHMNTSHNLPTDNNNEMDYDSNVLKTILDDKIDELNLDKVLVALESGPGQLPIKGDLHPSDDSNLMNDRAAEGEAELPLMDRLSSFAINEKHSIGEANGMLEHLSKMSSSAVNSGTTANTEEGVQGPEDYPKKTSRGVHAQGTDAEQTIFLDLRAASLVTSSKESLVVAGGQENFRESSSSSEEEDWNETRRSIKAGTFRTKATKPSARVHDKRDGEGLENKIHDRLSKRTYQRLVDEGRIEEGVLLNDAFEPLVDTEAGTSASPVPKRTGEPVFDLGPLEEKIRSWHEVGGTTGGPVYGASLGGSDVIDVVAKSGAVAAVEILGLNKSSQTKGSDGYSVGLHAGSFVTSSLGTSENKGTPVDTSLLRLEKCQLKDDKQGKNLLIVQTEQSDYEVAADSYMPSTSGVSVDENLEAATDATSPSCCIEELPDKVRISENLMVIKADISAICNSVDNGLLPGDMLETASLYTSKDTGIAGKGMRTGKGEFCEASTALQVGSSTSARGSTQSHSAGLVRMLSLEEVEKDLMAHSNCSNFRTKADLKSEGKKGPPENCELEMKTFSVDVDREEGGSHCPEHMIELSSTLKGLLPQYTGKIPRTPLRYAADGKNAYSCRQSEWGTGEETPMITRQENTTREISSDADRKKNEGLKVEVPVKEDKVGDNSSTGKLSNACDNVTSTEHPTNSKNKKKSKKKSRKGSEFSDEQCLAQTKGVDKSSGLAEKTGTSAKPLKSSKSLDCEQKGGKRPSNMLKESERQQIKEKIKKLQEEFGVQNVIFNEDVSFNQPFQPLPNTCTEAVKLLLKIPIEAPGICSKSCGKNSLSFDERSDAFIGLCTLFLSLLFGNKFKVSESLGIPFDVIALEQASIDSELLLVVGITENEAHTQSSQQLKRGKAQKPKKNFHQAVSQYLNKTDLEHVLSSLMGFDITERPYVSNVSCPGTKRLSTYISVSEDISAVARIFHLKPALLWNRPEQSDEPLSSDICWIEKEATRNENTCVLVENVTSMLPKTIATFFTTIRSSCLDISGLRVAYLQKKDGKEVPFLAAALRGPNVTTVQAGKSFTSNTEELASIKSVFMPSVDSSLTDGPRQVNVSLPSGMKSFETSVEDPLITYTIGRGRGEREVVNWFGRRTRQASDVETKGDDQAAAARHSSLPEKLDLLSRSTASASLLSVVYDRVVLTISPLVPTVFISIAMTAGESRGLRAVSAGKVLLNEDDYAAMGLKLDNSESKEARLNLSVAILVFEGENALHRAHGFKQYLFDALNEKLPHDALTKDALTQRLNGFIRYERIKQERSVDEFFAVKQITKRTIKVLETMTSPNESRSGCEVIGRLPPKWNFFLSPEMPRICTVVLVGQPMVETFPQTVSELLKDCVEDPLCINRQATTDRKYRQQERPIGEVIGLKYFKGLNRHLAHICCPHVFGANDWKETVDGLEKGPVIVLVLRLLDAIKNLEETRDSIYRSTSKLLNSNKLKCPPDSYHNTFIHTGLDTVFRVLLDMFKIDELMPDACHSWYQSTQWPVYVPMRHRFLQEIDSIVGVFTNANRLGAFRNSKESSKSTQQNNSEVSILSPTSLSIPAELILGKQQELSFIKFDVDGNYMKYIARALGILKRDAFHMVALNFPVGFSPSYDKVAEMHVAVRRPNAVFRLNQWLPELSRELKGKHAMHASRSAKDAFDAIVRSFQKTEAGGVFDDSLLTVTEKLDFTYDAVFQNRECRKVEWSCDNALLSGSKQWKLDAGTGHGFVMPEVIVVVLTSVMLRGRFLSEILSENVKALGFWEELCSLGFKTIGARMTALDQKQARQLLQGLKLSQREQRIMGKRLPSSNGPILVLALLKDFALSNFWSTLNKKLTEDECKIVSENVLVPTTKKQVEILLSSFFETLVPNSEVEIKRIKSER